ncbi:hypothetical protein CCR83_14585 [Rhodobacter veldkampii DSM 11550]|uniref:hypothetical protein n=1 Tax=Phaeovulum veldkampii TaxID=33049 RepID=UPI0010F3E9F5|nr:hypothetical protein [Phaeovulum veldkampii]MBK5947638.1 hypothetical protein [Phaeovulum veldkampii DSM 11550]TDQ56124.1 hypothetical protein EV658_12226 [Phaeovulum veldkampii DSM 11550]
MPANTRRDPSAPAPTTIPFIEARFFDPKQDHDDPDGSDTGPRMQSKGDIAHILATRYGTIFVVIVKKLSPRTSRSRAISRIDSF